LFVLSVLMGVPLHGVKYNHLRHHAHPLEEDDVEGSSAWLPGWLAILCGPYFTVHGQVRAFARVRGVQLRWMIAEAAALLVMWVLAITAHIYLLRYHLIVMAIGNCLTGFFAVWLVHHHCDDEEIFARTQRGEFINLVTFNLFYHLEHHLFPAVPACHLPELARRIDKACPSAARFSVMGSTTKSSPAREVSMCSREL
jgi:fatty acid desaturase